MARVRVRVTQIDLDEKSMVHCKELRGGGWRRREDRTMKGRRWS